MKVTVEELRKTEFYYRWAKSTMGGLVDEISVERRCITPEFEKFVTEHGYVKEKGRKGKYTDHFVYQGS